MKRRRKLPPTSKTIELAAGNAQIARDRARHERAMAAAEPDGSRLKATFERAAAIHDAAAEAHERGVSRLLHLSLMRTNLASLRSADRARSRRRRGRRTFPS